MTKFDETIEEGERRFGRGRYPGDAVARGRWINPLLGVLGVLVLSGYLMNGSPLTSAALTDQSTFSSTTGLLKAAFGAAVALAWAVFGAWLGMRRTRRPNPLDEPADDSRSTAYPPRPVFDSLRAPTCERMYDETRLVPHYLRRAQFPTTKRDLVRLAREHTDEGQALRRLECIPDRRYSTLHDLIREIRVD
jgi:hypothetical protein